MKSLPVRILSALVAVSLMVGSYVFYKETGLIFLCSMIQILITREFVRLKFNLSFDPTYFYLCSIGFVVTYLGMLFSGDHSFEILVLSFVVQNAFLLITARQNSLEDVFRRQGQASYGLFYCCTFPYFVVRILQLPMGALWFVTFLAVVFFGETAAYFVGNFLGRRKLFEKVSPAKTFEGAAGGLLFSLLVGLLASQFLNVMPLELGLICLISGVFAQFGDLIESQMKRISNVKDSGHIMPGHGGILDRLDGVLYAAPVFFILVYLYIFGLDAVS